MTLTHHYINIEHTNIHYVESVPMGKPTQVETLVFLHGFPEFWGTWHKQLEFFAPNYRVIAPDLPGYNLSDKPTDLEFYTVPKLIAFIAKLISAISPHKPVTLVAHDWGGAIAWPLAAFNASLLSRLVILNAAHPSTFTREMINNPNQRAKSAYIHQLISSGANSLLSQNNYQYLVDKLMQSQLPALFTDELLASYRQVWQQPGAINGMLQYYRAMPQLAHDDTNDNVGHGDTRLSHQVKPVSALKIPNIRINIPTLVLWGEQDLAFVNENLDGLTDYVTDCTIKRFSNTSHWIQHERPNEVNNAISEFLTSLQ
ncbi:alpha/beta hydrolase [Shewanella inventionis]|uniref:Alpha/beta hydrolase n=1 Tax=Shewanella inventionis TaxID=1738770 RepID=A0ABQ1JGL4_9GAMM|nr:alpha/beta hydrolase [Shewanella inventionis]MCL1158396.1 alpha/beta hydrolase [Shewanella inventionis]UAL41751.1 alpha/beta hydrolase [Shewanella inventionis]GGB68469.1 alpha/beta hydrolase [Shewanella inventionis]